MMIDAVNFLLIHFLVFKLFTSLHNCE